MRVIDRFRSCALRTMRERDHSTAFKDASARPSPDPAFTDARRRFASHHKHGQVTSRARAIPAADTLRRGCCCSPFCQPPLRSTRCRGRPHTYRICTPRGLNTPSVGRRCHVRSAPERSARNPDSSYRTVRSSEAPVGGSRTPRRTSRWALCTRSPRLPRPHGRLWRRPFAGHPASRTSASTQAGVRSPPSDRTLSSSYSLSSACSCSCSLCCVVMNVVDRPSNVEHALDCPVKGIDTVFHNTLLESEGV
jgi:hypothetical protein